MSDEGYVLPMWEDPSIVAALVRWHPAGTVYYRPASEALLTATGEGPGPANYFRADLLEVVLTRLGEPADHLLIASWHEGRGLQRIARR